MMLNQHYETRDQARQSRFEERRNVRQPRPFAFSVGLPVPAAVRTGRTSLTLRPSCVGKFTKGYHMSMRLVVTSLAIVVGLHSQATAQQTPTPSEEHRIVMQDVGEWTVKGKMIVPEGHQEFESEETVVAIGEFWTVSHYSSDIFGGLKGSSTIGFDPITKQFVGTWVDSFQPAATHMKGIYDKETKTMTYETTGIGLDGKPNPGKIIIQYKGADSRTFKMMHKDPTGQTDQMVSTMEMTYTRKSGKNEKK